MKLGNLMIFVTDFEKAKWFYCELLGFTLVSEDDQRLVITLEGCEIVAYKCEKTSQVTDYSNEARAVFVFEVQSVDETFEHLKSVGVQFLHDTPAQNDVNRYVAFVDPFGIVHEIAESIIQASSE